MTPSTSTRSRLGRALLGASLLVALASSVSPWEAVSADAPVFGAHDVPTAFSIRRSLNRNRVDYAVRLDASCRAVDSEPVEPYWRMFETDGSVAALLPREQRAYGVASQTVQAHRAGSRVRVQLRALAERAVTVRTRRAGRGCVAESVMRIAGVEARVEDIYVVLASPVRVDHVQLRGVALAGGASVQEALRD